MHLCYKYPIIYWNTANLIVDSGSLEESDKKKGTNYGKIATAIRTIAYAGASREGKKVKIDIETF